jgi:MoaA/NifB/PqqE/SkfB family radical SAM enzyme
MTHRIERMPILILFPHSRCNCRCVMCDIWKTDAIQEISAADLERHAEDIEQLGVEWVVLSGGEPLMHSDLFRLCAMLRARNIRLTLLSTGLLLERNASRIVEHIHDVIVSLDGPPDVHDRIRRVPRAFDLLGAGVQALRRLDSKFPIAARCTVQKANHARLRDTADSAREIGLDSISFLACDLESTAFNRPSAWPPERQDEVGLTAAECDALEAEMKKLVGPFILESPEKLGRIVRHFRAHLGLEQHESPRCNAPWVSAVVESDGSVRPCFFHAPIGSLRDASLMDVLNGAPAVAFREGLDVSNNPVCRKCVCSLYRERQ